jgi:hypothetical protein
VDPPSSPDPVSIVRGRLSMGPRIRRAWLLAGLLAAGFVAVAPPPAQAATEPPAVAVVVDQSGNALDSGGSATPFTLQLPSGAACPGDTYHHDYLVFSYGVPVLVSPASLTFPGTFPRTGVDLITLAGEPFVTQATAPFTGGIQTLPGFSWSRYDHDPADFPLGMYNVGIACAQGLGTVARYWNVRIDFMANDRDPGGFSWQVVSPPAAPSGQNGDDTLVLVATVVGVVILASGLALLLRRRQRRALAARS